MQGLRQGDAQAGHEFWKRYGPTLQRLAHKHLAAWLQRRVDPEDIVQSACRSFWRHLHAGEYQLADEQGLVALLSAITLNKVLMKSRFHRAKRRDVLREEHIPAADSTEASLEVAAPDASPDEAAAFAEQFQEFLCGLD